MNLSYLSGLIDGEGYIGITRVKNKSGRWHYNYKAQVKIGMTNKKFIKLVSKYYNGGNLYSFQANGKDGKKNKKAKRCYEVRWIKISKIVELLEKITPFLILKNKQARLVLKFAKKRLPKVSLVDRKGRFLKFTKDEVSLYYKVKRLNKRGV